MKRRTLVKAGIAALTGGWLFGNRSPLANGDEPKPREIPLETVYSTSGQKQLRAIWKEHDALTQQALKTLDDPHNRGLDNLALVRGRTISEAVWACERAFRGNAGASAAWHPEGAPSEEIWLVVYLGTAGSNGPAYHVKSVTIMKNTIRFSYEWTDQAVTDDEHPYYYWIPLGKLPTGVYQLEQFNVKDDVVKLSRRVKVTPQPK